MEPPRTPSGPPPDQPESAPHPSPQPTTDSQLPTPNSQLPTPDSRLPTPNSRLPTPNSRPTPCRLLLEPPASGAWNMAVDEWLMEWSASTGGCGWRIYAWQEPTLSLGYFQSHEDRRGHAASLNCPAVRRLSGGGAIVHDAELTYSFVLPRGHPLALRRRGLYEAVHTTLIEVLGRQGIRACLYGESGGPRVGRSPFLCFLRRAPGDVLVGSAKIAGSAQRRSAEAVLQHGSVLWARSLAAPELEGLDDLANGPIRRSEFAEAWLEALGARLGLAWQDRPLCQGERRRVADLVAAKYGTEGWTLRRGRRHPCRSPSSSI
jgi:lipoate-protein ligase A